MIESHLLEICRAYWAPILRGSGFSKGGVTSMSRSGLSRSSAPDRTWIPSLHNFSGREAQWPFANPTSSAPCARLRMRKTGFAALLTIPISPPARLRN